MELAPAVRVRILAHNASGTRVAQGSGENGQADVPAGDPHGDGTGLAEDPQVLRDERLRQLKGGDWCNEKTTTIVVVTCAYTKIGPFISA